MGVFCSSVVLRWWQVHFAPKTDFEASDNSLCLPSPDSNQDLIEFSSTSHLYNSHEVSRYRSPNGPSSYTFYDKEKKNLKNERWPWGVHFAARTEIFFFFLPLLHRPPCVCVCVCLPLVNSRWQCRGDEEKQRHLSVWSRTVRVKDI